MQFHYCTVSNPGTGADDAYTADRRYTLRAPLSGTFLQTLPDLVTPLKGHSYLLAAVHRRGQRPPKGFGTAKTVEATKRPSTHVNMRRIHPV